MDEEILLLVNIVSVFFLNCGKISVTKFTVLTNFTIYKCTVQ